ncbi:LuxR C-terminal-related transcriptional regulator [Desertivirga brevis]|uniref:LuxR C-terminal-related transcriptional regulator n=1 Tax=Desertivirga brevis TaxID=2810310 RepID=UPI001A95AD9D|nr:response regulator transcription factor [Pedobacter sp. SYSU D00873]
MKNIIISFANETERDCIRALLETNNNLGMIKEVSTLEQILALAETGTSGIVVIDSDLGQEDEFLKLRKLNYRHPELQIIAVTSNDQQSTVKKVFETGVKAYLLKGCSAEELNLAINEVLKGRMYICSALGFKFLRQNSIINSTSEATVNLTSRELEVLSLIAEGYTNYEIADKLFTSRRTVEGHRLSLSRKLGVKNSAQMIKVAYKSGLIEAA